MFNHFQNSDTKQLHLGKISTKLRVAKCIELKNRIFGAYSKDRTS